MVDLICAKDILLDLAYISNITVQKNSPYKSKGFTNGLQCDFLLRECAVPVFIGIAETWERDLMSIYVVNPLDIPFMPHVEADGKICLFDLEGILIDLNFEGLLEQCVQRAYNILQHGFYENNDHEFAREFASYWSYQKPKRYMKFAIPKNHKSQLMKYCDPATSLKRKRKESEAAFINRKNTAEILAAVESEYFKLWSITGTQLNGIYLHIEPYEYILPPDPREKLRIEYVQKLLSFVPSIDLKKWIQKIGMSSLMVFEIVEPGEEIACIGIMYCGLQLEECDGHLILKESNGNYELCAVSVSRIDEEFLTQRTQIVLVENCPKILVIGCGSIGGYLCPELIKAGYKDLTLVDGDILKAENIYRHFLGIDYVGKYKAEALRSYCEDSFPQVKIETLDSNVEELIEDESIALSSYDIIISATGNHNINRWLNRRIREEQVKIPCIYLWNEPLDVGCHLAIIQLNYQGCYECFFDRNEETNDLYDVTAFSRPGQIITKNSRGCSGSFVPYSSNVSLRIVATCMEWLEKILTGRCDNNILVSIKGDAYNFRKEGYACSRVYYDQSEKEKVIDGSEFYNSKCRICGEYIDGI